jgi:lysophospholipase L1-like esterase
MTARLPLVLFLISAISQLTAQQQQQSLRWLQLPNPQVEVDGLPWYRENGGELSRLPMMLKNSFRKPVWDLAQSPSGARLRFRTNSSTLAIRLEYPHPPNMTNMHAFGQTGADLYIDGVYRNTAIAAKDSKPGQVQEHSFYKDEPRVERQITLYLPLYTPVKIVGLGLDTDARIDSAEPFKLSKPIVFYGTSITQGGCASRSGMSYQAILGRALNIDFVNLGFSGNGKGEPEMARTVAEIDAAYFVLDFAQNNPTVDSLKQVYAPFVDTIRSKHPATPILVITPIYSARESWSKDERLDQMREVIRQVGAQRIAAGDRNLQIVEGTDLIGPSRGDGLVDGTHPNDLGFEWMAEGLAQRISKVLGLKLQR